MKVNESSFLEERQAQIQKLVYEYKRITVQELSKYFKISAVTIRNDLNALEKAGKIVRTHGGAIAVEEQKKSGGLDSSLAKEGDIKKAIAMAAVNLIEDGEVIFIDGGTTCSLMYTYLTAKNDLTVITPSLETAYWLSKASTVNVHMLGGKVRRETLVSIGTGGNPEFSGWNIAKAFISAYSFTPEDGIMDVYHFPEDQRVPLIRQARQIVALIDSSKWGKISMASLFASSELSILITDTSAPPDMVRQLEKTGVQIILT